jgi:hypothetical protein
MSKRDIVEKLRAPAYWMSGSNEGHEGENDAPRQAADEIDRLRAEVQKLDSECTDLATDLCTQKQDNASLAGPWRVVNPLRAENAQLRAALHGAVAWWGRIFIEPTPKWVKDARAALEGRTALQDKSDESAEVK